MFAKYWLPGAVKTRLARSIGDDRASRLYREFVETLLTRFHELGDRRIVAYSPRQRREEFAAIAPTCWELAPQSTGDLGERLNEFFRSHLTRPDDRLVLIGTDSPTLPRGYIEQAFDALSTSPVVLGPTGDGGYYLVGATGQVPPIFTGIDWSTPRVWQQTVACLRQADCPFATLPLWYDIDDVADLEHAAQELAQLVRADPAWRNLTNHVQIALAGSL